MPVTENKRGIKPRLHYSEIRAKPLRFKEEKKYFVSLKYSSLAWFLQLCKYGLKEILIK